MSVAPPRTAEWTVIRSRRCRRAGARRAPEAVARSASSADVDAVAVVTWQ